MLKAFLERRSVEGVIIGGGSPCQGNSSLNRHRKGLGDTRSHQPSELIRNVREIEEMEIARGLKIRYFLENVASSPRSVIKHYNSLMEAVPARVQASQFGWVHRNRLFWLGAMQDFSHTRMLARIGFLQRDLWWDLVIELPKPIPSQLHMEKGFTLKIDPKANIQDQKLPRMFTFTREFPHPLDSDQAGTAQAVARFEQDVSRSSPMRTSRLPGARRSGAHSPLQSAPSFMAYHQTQCPRQHFVVLQRISVLKSATVGSGTASIFLLWS